jgi:hypothetical protein
VAMGWIFGSKVITLFFYHLTYVVLLIVSSYCYVVVLGTCYTFHVHAISVTTQHMQMLLFFLSYTLIWKCIYLYTTHTHTHTRTQIHSPSLSNILCALPPISTVMFSSIIKNHDPACLTTRIQLSNGFWHKCYLITSRFHFESFSQSISKSIF